MHGKIMSWLQTSEKLNPFKKINIDPTSNLQDCQHTLRKFKTLIF